MRALTPDPLRIAGQVSSLISHTRPDIPPPTTWPARTAFPIANPNVSGVFQASPSPSRLAAVSPPNRVRHPADCQFASGCSPPRLAATQLPSATGSWLAPTRTCTVRCVRLHERTRSGLQPATSSGGAEKRNRIHQGSELPDALRFPAYTRSAPLPPGEGRGEGNPTSPLQH